MTRHNVALHILYGIPCVGKSTAAVELAYRQNIRTVIHTDYVREVQRGCVPLEQYPALAKVTHNAWELHGAPTSRNIVAGFNDHVEVVATGIGIVVNKLALDGFDAVIEGVHFRGSMIEDLRVKYDRVNIQATLLVVRTAEELQQRISDKESRRARGAEPKRWHENIPAMLTIQEYLITDAHAHGIRIVAGDQWRTCEFD